MNNSIALRDILEARSSLDATHHPMVWPLILSQAIGRAAEAICDRENTAGTYRGELIQSGAIALAAIETFDRGQWNWPNDSVLHWVTILAQDLGELSEVLLAGHVAGHHQVALAEEKAQQLASTVSDLIVFLKRKSEEAGRPA